MKRVPDSNWSGCALRRVARSLVHRRWPHRPHSRHTGSGVSSRRRAFGLELAAACILSTWGMPRRGAWSCGPPSYFAYTYGNVEDHRGAAGSRPARHREVWTERAAAVPASVGGGHSIPPGPARSGTHPNALTPTPPPPSSPGHSGSLVAANRPGPVRTGASRTQGKSPSAR